jgi:CheY-like chemotaxis protein
MDTEQHPIQGKRVLLVEDDQGARASVKLLLSIDRHSTVEAQNGQEALKLFAEQPFDLVILDYFMTGMRGDAVARAIRHASPTQRIIMISAYTEKLSDAEKPVDVCLGKPFSINELRRAILSVLS